MSYHTVATLDEVKDLIEKNTSFWISSCECRKSKGNCQYSPNEVCLGFTQGGVSNPDNARPIAKEQALELLTLAKKNRLVPRPGKDKDKKTDGVCFCCPDCCCYFIGNDLNKSDKGAYIEQTNYQLCNHCGVCINSCYFGARSLIDGKLAINSSLCYGCGICVSVCNRSCINMIKIAHKNKF